METMVMVGLLAFAGVVGVVVWRQQGRRDPHRGNGGEAHSHVGAGDGGSSTACGAGDGGCGDGGGGGGD